MRALNALVVMIVMLAMVPHAMAITLAGNLALNGTVGVEYTHTVISADGKWAFVAASQGGLHVANIENTNMPWFAASFAYPTERASEITLLGNYLFVAATDGVKIMNVIDPTSPTQLRDIALEAPSSSCISLDNRYIFIAYSAGSIRVMDLEFPDDPGQTTDIIISVTSNLPVGARLTCTESLLFFAAGSRGTFLIDIRDPVNMGQASVLTSYTINAYSNMAATNNNGTLYIAKDTGVGFYNITSPDEAPSHLYDAPGGGQVAWLKYANGELSLADATPSDGGLHTVYLTNNKITASSQTGAAFCVDVFGNVGVVAMGDGGLDVFDVTPGPSPPPSIVTPNPPPPTPVPTLPPPPTPTPSLTLTRTLSPTLTKSVTLTIDPNLVTDAPTLSPTQSPPVPSTLSPTQTPPGTTVSPPGTTPNPPGATPSPPIPSTQVPDIPTKFTPLSGCVSWSASTRDSLASVEMIPGRYEGEGSIQITVSRKSTTIAWITLGIDITTVNGTIDMLIVKADSTTQLWTIRDANQNPSSLITTDSQDGIFYGTPIPSSANTITFYKKYVTAEVTGDANAKDANFTVLSGRSLLLSAGTANSSASIDPSNPIPYGGCSEGTQSPSAIVTESDDDGLPVYAIVIIIVGSLLVLIAIALYLRTKSQADPVVNFGDAVELLESHHNSVKGPSTTAKVPR